jgi:zeta-carotene isomerase
MWWVYMRAWQFNTSLQLSQPSTLHQVWIQPGTGLADDYVAFLGGISPSSEVTILIILFLFAVAHSGLAGLRTYGMGRV